MEPDVKRLLQQKIRAVEKETVSWNKEDVWSRVENKISSRKRTYRFFYYVAAAVVLVFLSLTPWLNQKSVQLKTGTKDPSDTRMGADNEQVVLLPPVHNSAKVLIEKAPVSQVKSIQSKNSDHNKSSDARLMEEQALIHFTPEPKVPDLKLLDDRAELSMPETAEAKNDEKIEPIIGVMDSKNKDAVANNPKRKRWIRKLEPAETEEEKAILNTILFARNK